MDTLNLTPAQVTLRDALMNGPQPAADLDKRVVNALTKRGLAAFDTRSGHVILATVDDDASTLTLHNPADAVNALADLDPSEPPPSTPDLAPETNPLDVLDEVAALPTDPNPSPVRARSAKATSTPRNPSPVTARVNALATRVRDLDDTVSRFAALMA